MFTAEHILKALLIGAVGYIVGRVTLGDNVPNAIASIPMVPMTLLGQPAMYMGPPPGAYMPPPPPPVVSQPMSGAVSTPLGRASVFFQETARA